MNDFSAVAMEMFCSCVLQFLPVTCGSWALDVAGVTEGLDFYAVVIRLYLNNLGG